eukprot:RCo018060
MGGCCGRGCSPPVLSSESPSVPAVALQGRHQHLPSSSSMLGAPARRALCFDHAHGQSTEVLGSPALGPARRAWNPDGWPTPSNPISATFRALSRLFAGSPQPAREQTDSPQLAGIMPSPKGGNTWTDYPSATTLEVFSADQQLVGEEQTVQLRPFLPSWVITQALGLQKNCAQVEGCVAFVDVSGFSALTHSLSRNPKGAMLVSQYLNDYLSGLLAVVSAADGDVVCFLGDAFMALWRHTPPEPQKAAVLRATQCSLELLRRYNGYQVPGTAVSLNIHVGVSYGCSLGMLVDSGQGRRLFLLAGRLLLAVGAAVELASPGQVCLTGDAHLLIHDHVRGRLCPNSPSQDHYIVSNIYGAVGEPSTPTRKLTAPEGWSVAQHRVLQEYLPAVLHEYLCSVPTGASRSTLALQRFVSVLFVGQCGLRYSDMQAVKHFATAALEIVFHNDGEVLQAIQDDKGLHIVAVFGVQSTEQPSIPAVTAAMEMLACPHINSTLQCQIGVATGDTFCGIVGSDSRKAFDILGEPVNLACRLMSLCPRVHHCFLCDETTTLNCQGRFLFQRLPKRYPLKGQSMPRVVFTLQEDQQQGGAGLGLDILRRRLEAHGTAICGRHQEKALLYGAVRGVIASRS